MPKNISFGSPLLLKELKKKYGNKQTTKSVPMREARDISEFLESKREAEKKTAEENLVFRTAVHS